MKYYNNNLTANINRKGVLDIDTVKGCTFGMAKYPNGGCYGLCYAAKTAKIYGYDFSKSVSRYIKKNNDQPPILDGFVDGAGEVVDMVKKHKMSWFRIGTMGDPSHDWELTIDISLWLGNSKTPIIITKHWVELPSYLLSKIKGKNIIINTSVSPLDTAQEREYRLYQFNRLKSAGIRSVLRVVSCKFGNTDNGRKLNNIQKRLFENKPIIDNPLRIPKNDKRVQRGDIIVERVKDLNSLSFISKVNSRTYVGKCASCPDQCGVNLTIKYGGENGTRINVRQFANG